MTHLNKIGTGPCLTLASPLVVPFLSGIRFSLLSSPGSPLAYFSFHDDLNVLSCLKISTAGGSVQRSAFVLCSHAVVIDALCVSGGMGGGVCFVFLLKYARPSTKKDVIWLGMHNLH